MTHGPSTTIMPSSSRASATIATLPTQVSPNTSPQAASDRESSPGGPTSTSSSSAVATPDSTLGPEIVHVLFEFYTRRLTSFILDPSLRVFYTLFKSSAQCQWLFGKPLCFFHPIRLMTCWFLDCHCFCTAGLCKQSILSIGQWSQQCNSYYHDFRFSGT